MEEVTSIVWLRIVKKKIVRQYIKDGNTYNI